MIKRSEFQQWQSTGPAVVWPAESGSGVTTPPGGLGLEQEVVDLRRRVDYLESEMSNILSKLSTLESNTERTLEKIEVLDKKLSKTIEFEPEVIVIEQIDKDTAKERVSRFMRERTTTDIEEIQKELHINLKMLIEIIDELKREGKVEAAE